MLIPQGIFKALNNFQKYNKWQTKLPVQWNPKLKAFFWETDGVWKWYLSYIIFVVGQSFILSLFCVGHNILWPNKDSFLYIPTLSMVAFAGGGGMLFGFALVTKGKEYVTILNACIVYSEKTIPNAMMSLGIKPETKPNRKKSQDLVGSAIAGIVTFFCIFPPLFSIPPTLSGTSNSQFLAKLYLPPEIHNFPGMWLLIGLLTHIIITVTAGEIFRLVPFILFSQCIPSIEISNAYEIYESYVKRTKRPNFVAISYFCSQVSVLVNARFVTCMTHDFWIYLAGISAPVAGNYMAIKGYAVFPSWLYPLIPTVALGVLSIVAVMIPRIVEVVVRSERCLGEWKKIISNGKYDKYFKKRFAAHCPIKFKIGVLGFVLVVVTNSFNSEFYQTICDKTSDAVLTVPISTIQTISQNL